MRMTMSKTPTISDLPGVGPDTVKATPKRKKPAAKPKPAQPKREERKLAAVTIAATMVNDAPGFQTNRVQLQHLPREERDTLKRLWMGLDAAGATLNDGRPVDRASRALRFLLQQLAAAERGEVTS